MKVKHVRKINMIFIRKQFQKYDWVSAVLFLGCFLFIISPLFSLTLAESPQRAASPKAHQQKPINVQKIKSNKGITAWFVETHEIPVVSIALAIKNAGFSNEPKGLSGLVSLLTTTLDEGSGPWNSQEFKKFLLQNNIELNISAVDDTFQLSFRTVKKSVNEAFKAVHAIFTSPRFNDEALARVKNQLITHMEQSLHDEHNVANETLGTCLYGDHPYGKTTQQALNDLPKITQVHLRQFMKERFAKDQLLISIVGDITEKEVKKYLDETFGDLPAKALPSPVKEAVFHNLGSIFVKKMVIPQSLVLFAQPGIKRTDPDFYAAFVLLRIIGDGQFASRLWNEVREKRGLAYGIEAELNYAQHAATIMGATATKNSTVKETMDIIRKVWETATTGVTQEELDFVKQRMIGSFALNFSSTLRIARALLIYQIDNLGTNYINIRNNLVASLTLDHLNRVAKTLLKPDKLTFVVVGNPDKELSFRAPNSNEEIKQVQTPGEKN
ncbi:MAG: insulinase family protein [Alphaproteobacteria bacterium]|nr:insulinase family protein [Alphaproteobacteria bacterium]